MRGDSFCEVKGEKEEIRGSEKISNQEGPRKEGRVPMVQALREKEGIKEKRRANGKTSENLRGHPLREGLQANGSAHPGE